MESHIETSRLHLIRLTDTAKDSQHIQWFHEIWSDADITAWSLHGKCTSLSESHDWMIQQLTKWDTQFFAIFLKAHSPPPPSLMSSPPKSASSNINEEPALGELMGFISIRLSPFTPPLPTFPPNYPPNISPSPTTPLDFRFIGYALFRRFWGNGYATEAGKAVLPPYAAWRAREHREGEVSYLEAHVDVANPASGRVMEKLGFEKVGLKEDEGKVFSRGEWREERFWVYGKFV